MGRKKRSCPICHSTSWRKEPSSGLVLCGEGHVLQGYRNETNEATNLGPHAVKKRSLKSGRQKQEKVSDANPKLYHGARASYHYFTCQQLILRLQITNLVQAWKLPTPQFETICRDCWSLHLCLLPDPPSLDPPGDEDSPTDHSQAESGEESPSSSVRQSTVVGDDDGQTSNGEEVVSKAQALSAESEPENLESLFEEGRTYPRLDPDPNMARLLRAASESLSDESRAASPTPANQPKFSRSKHRTSKYASPAANIAILVIACWTLRIPVIYNDFIRLIQAYTLLYLDPLRHLPNSVLEPLTKSLKQALSPHHPPAIPELHSITSRLAKLLEGRYGIRIPELNAGPVLWRATRALGGPAALYSLSKNLASTLSLSLTLHRNLAPPLVRQHSGDPKYHMDDNGPPEVNLIACVVLVYKLVYGFDGKQRSPRSPKDPACCLAEQSTLLEYLAETREAQLQSTEELFSQTSQRSVFDLSDKEMDYYLEFCERALLRHNEFTSANTGLEAVAAYFPLVSPKPGTDFLEDEPLSQAKTLVANNIQHSVSTSLLPAERISVFNSQDTLGCLPSDYELVLEVASKWAGIGLEDMSTVIERFERRTTKWWRKQQKVDKVAK